LWLPNEMLILTPDVYTITAILGVCAYYAAASVLIVRASGAGTIVTLYEPPEHLSPAAVRYAWKRTFDDRTFWAAVLSVISKGLATIQSEDGAAVLRLTPPANLKLLLPQEEKLLLDEMPSHRRRKGMKVNMLDGRMAVIVSEMADFLRREALGVSFKDNRTLPIIGTMLSPIAILVAARPRWARTVVRTRDIFCLHGAVGVLLTFSIAPTTRLVPNSPR